MTANLHVGDIGTTILITVNNQDGTAVNLSSFTSLILVMKRSDGTIVERPCVFTTNGTDGRVQYITVLGDLTVQGNFKFQVRCISASGVWHSNILTHKVYPNVGN